MRVTLGDGRALTVPSTWYSRLTLGTAKGELDDHRWRRGRSLATTRRGRQPLGAFSQALVLRRVSSR